MVQAYLQSLTIAKINQLYSLEHADWEGLTIDQLQESLIWLEDRKPIWLKWREIRKQQSEDRWTWYQQDPSMFSGFREVLLHQEALKELREAFNTKNRPNIFKKPKGKKK